MRAAEFIPEKINTAITEPSFRDKKRIGKFVYTAEYYRPHRPSQSDWIKVSCKYYFKTVGWAIFKVIGVGDDAHLVSQDTEVVPKYRKQGIATAMYEYARSLGNDIMPSPGQLPDGEAMWAAWRKSGKVSQQIEYP